MEALVTTLINQFGIGIGLGIFFAVIVALILRNRASTQDYTARMKVNMEAEASRADIEERKRLNNGIFALVDQLGKRSEEDRRRYDEDRKGQIENNLTLKSAVAKIEGMMLIIADNTQTTKGLTLSFNDLESGFIAARDVLKKVDANTETLKTDIVGETSLQFGPVVEALRGINTQLETLSRKVTEKDGDTAASFRQLVESIGKLEIILLRVLEPAVINQFRIGEMSNEQPSVTP